MFDSERNGPADGSCGRNATIAFTESYQSVRRKSIQHELYSSISGRRVFLHVRGAVPRKNPGSFIHLDDDSRHHFSYSVVCQVMETLLAAVCSGQMPQVVQVLMCLVKTVSLASP